MQSVILNQRKLRLFKNKWKWRFKAFYWHSTYENFNILSILWAAFFMSDRWKLCLFWGNMSHILDLMLQGCGGAGWTLDCRGVSEGALAFQNWSECPFNFWRQPFFSPSPVPEEAREKRSLHRICSGLDLAFFLVPRPSCISVHISVEWGEGGGETTTHSF